MMNPKEIESRQIPSSPVPAPILPNDLKLAPSVPPKRESKPKDSIGKEKKRISVQPNDMATLFWNIALLTFVIMTIGYWAAFITSYNIEHYIETGKIIAGFDPQKFIFALTGTLLSFTNVVLGGIIKLFTRKIDEKQLKEDEARLDAEQTRQERDIAEKNNDAKDKRILDLESQLLNLSMKLQKIAEDQLKTHKQ